MQTVEKGKSGQKQKNLFLVCAHLPLSPRKARHFPPCSGEAYIKEERIIVFIILNAFDDILCRILTAPVGRVWRLIVFSRRYAPKNTIRLPSLLITTAQE